MSIYIYIYYRANSKQIILYTRACCGAVCSLTVDVTTGWMLLYRAGRRTMGTVFLTAVAADHSGTRHVVKEFSETPFTSETPSKKRDVRCFPDWWRCLMILWASRKKTFVFSS